MVASEKHMERNSGGICGIIELYYLVVLVAVLLMVQKSQTTTWDV